MKGLLRIFIVLTAFVVTLSPMSQQIVSLDSASKNHDYQTEVFYDDDGNKIELEYILNEEGLRVNTYVNGELAEYSTRDREGDGLSDEIVNYFIHSPLDSKGINSNEIKEVKKYNVKEIISEVDREVETAAVPGGYKWVRSLKHSGYNLTGHLYLNLQVERTKSYEYDFLQETGLSAIASAISYVFNTLIVAIATLLGSLGVSYSGGVINESLNGWYNAYDYGYNYLVQVNNKNVLWHKQNKKAVTYYRTDNGKQSVRNKYSTNWYKETDLLNDGINNYVYGRY